MRKKIFFLFLMTFVIVQFSSTNLVYNNEETILNEIKFENNQAIADPGFEVGPFCAHISYNMCWIFDDGFFIMGTLIKETQ